MTGSREKFHPPRGIAKTSLFQQCEPVADDDSWESAGWYCRRLIIQELERGVTQQEIADRIKVTQPVISSIKNARTLPHLATLIALAKYFRRTPGELLDESIKWWTERGGRQESLDVQREAYERRLDSAATGPRRAQKKR